MHYLSIDFGTSTVKMEILDDALQVLASEKQEYPYILLPGEKVEIDPDVLFAATAQAAQRLPAELRQKVDVLCYDTFSPSPVFIAEDGTLVYPNIITHMDRRSRSITDYIDEKVGKDKYLSIAGIYPFAGGAGIMTVLWMQQNEPEVLDRTYRIGHLPTYVHHRLTGEWMVDLVNASMLGLYETTTQGGWSRELLDAFTCGTTCSARSATPVNCWARCCRRRPNDWASRPVSRLQSAPTTWRLPRWAPTTTGPAAS